MRRRKSKERTEPAKEIEPIQLPKEIYYVKSSVSILDPVMWFVGLSILSVYSFTLYPSIAGGDSGELVAESCHLGVSHPPGYPLFNMLNYIAVHMPGNRSKAWKANVFSAVCDSACSMVIYCIVVSWKSTERLILTKLAGAIAAMTFAFSPLIWTYAISAEVFAMNNLFAALLVFILIQYGQTNAWSYIYIGAFLCGLALCNQHTIILFEIPIIVWVLWTQRSYISLSNMGKLIFFFLLGLLPYMYMPIVSILNPQPGSWGDLTSFNGFLHHIRRGDYGTFRLFATDRETESLQTRLIYYFRDAIVREGGYVIAPLAVVGLCQRPCTHHSHLHSLGYVILAMYFFYLIVFHSLSNLPLTEGLLYGVHMRFWQQPNVILFAWGGIGLSTIMQWGNKRSMYFTSLVVILTIPLPFIQCYTWYSIGNQSQAWYIQNYAKALLDPLPRNALVFVNYDLQWTAMRYLQRCEGFRTDLTVLNLSMMTYKWFSTKRHLYPQLSFPGDRLVAAAKQQDGGFNMRELLQANIKRFPSGIFLGGQLNFPDAELHKDFITVPYGLLDRFHPTSKPVFKSLKKWVQLHHKTMKKVHSHLPQLPSTQFYNDETWEWTIARDYHMKRLSAATFLLDETIKGNGNITWLAECARPLEHSLLHEPKQFWSETLLKNLGLAYAYIVRSADDFPVDGVDPFESHVGKNVTVKTKWKDRASERMLEVWRQWIALPSARADPGYQAIADIVMKFS